MLKLVWLAKHCIPWPFLIPLVRKVLLKCVFLDVLRFDVVSSLPSVPVFRCLGCALWFFLLFLPPTAIVQFISPASSNVFHIAMYQVRLPFKQWGRLRCPYYRSWSRPSQDVSHDWNLLPFHFNFIIKKCEWRQTYPHARIGALIIVQTVEVLHIRDWN